MIDAATRRQFIRYASVGLISNLLLYLAYLALTALGMAYLVAMSLLYVSGVLSTFLANRGWSFGHTGLAQGAFVRYVLAYLLGYLLNFGLLWLAVDQMNLPHQGAQAIAIVVVAACLFLMQKFWVFSPTCHGDGA